MDSSARAALPWWDFLKEGVVLLEGESVLDLNQAAARLLDADRERARGAAAIGVLRDHRLEAMWRSGVGGEIELRSKAVRVTAFPGGLAFEDVSELRLGQRDAAELLSVLSHELRTPVTTVRGALEALEAPAADGGDPGEVRFRERFLALALAEAERLSRLLDDLTVQSRPPRERSVELGAVVAKAEALLRARAEAAGVRFATELGDLLVWADEDKLLQVVLNLMENAAVHGPRGGVVAVAAWRADGMARLEVRDEGVPLDPGGVPALFAPHTQGRHRGQGAGLGLYIVRTIVQRWGGTVWGGPLGAGRDGAGPPGPAGDGGRRDGDGPGGAVGNAFGFSVPLASRA